MKLQQEIAQTSIALVAALSFATALADDFDSEQSDLEVIMRTNVLVGDNTPASNVMGVGVIGRFYLDDGWFAGATLDTYEYDFEHPGSTSDMVQNTAAGSFDSAANNVVLGGFVGRVYGKKNRGFDWFWSAGVGLGFRDIDSFSGTIDSGNSVAISYDSGTEYLLTGALGTSYHFTPTWSATFAARLEHYFMDVTATDSIGGSRTTFDSQSPYGAYISIDFRF